MNSEPKLALSIVITLIIQTVALVAFLITDHVTLMQVKTDFYTIKPTIVDLAALHYNELHSTMIYPQKENK